MLLFHCNSTAILAYLRPKTRVVRHYFWNEFRVTLRIPSTLIAFNRSWATMCIHQMVLDSYLTLRWCKRPPKWLKIMKKCIFVCFQKTHLVWLLMNFCTTNQKMKLLTDNKTKIYHNLKFNHGQLQTLMESGMQKVQGADSEDCRAIWIRICRAQQKPGNVRRNNWTETALTKMILTWRMIGRIKLTKAYLM